MDLGLLDGSLEQNIEQERFKRFYMHRTGHWLGMDVHDVGDYKIDDKWRELEPGMTFTVEPGLYIPAADDIDPRTVKRVKMHGFRIGTRTKKG